MFRKFARTVLAGVGMHAFLTRTMPRGISLHVDLKRLFGSTPPTVIFDVGANVGQTTAAFAESFKQARIFAFEPIRSTFECLVKNSARHPLVVQENIALGNSDGKSLMSVGAQSGWSRVVSTDAADASATRALEEVSMLRLDTYCEQRRIARINILKTDCEGFDLEVLQGARAMLENGRIDAIYAEVNFLRNETLTDFFALESYLSGLGFVFYALYDYSGWQYDVSTDGFTNALFISKNLARR